MDYQNNIVIYDMQQVFDMRQETITFEDGTTWTKFDR